MALSKPITKPNGITLNYHRIAMVKIDTNQLVTILVHSYLATNARQYEKDYAAGLIEGDPTFPYVDAQYFNCEYDENMSVKNAYEYLKTLPEFEGAEDV